MEAETKDDLHVGEIRITTFLRIVRLAKDLPLPRYQSDGAAGLDLHAAEERLALHPGSIWSCPTGIVVEIPRGFVGLIRPRSGISARFGVTMISSGVIDADYRGQVHVPLINHGDSPVRIGFGERVAQMLVMPVATCKIIEVERVEDLTATARGERGFGSTGRQ